MDYKEAADRIEDHMIVHHMDEQPHAVKITEALSMAIALLRKAAGDYNEIVIEECDERMVYAEPRNCD